MGIKFFGQFLIERGVIDDGQLRAGLELMNRENRSLGELAVEHEVMTPQSTLKVNAQQRHQDRPFGELAVEMGLLTELQLDRLIHAQERTRLPLGQSLVRIGALSQPSLAELLEAFEADQAPYRLGAVRLPSELSSSELAPVILDLLPKMLMRMARVVGKLGASESRGASERFEYCADVVVRGTSGLRVVLMGDDDFSRCISAGTSHLDPEVMETELVEDGLGEFLNVLAGNALGILERRGIVAELEPPRVRAAAGSGMHFELAVSTGQAALVLEAL